MISSVTARAGAVLVYETLLAFGMRQLVGEYVHIQQRRGDHTDFDKISDLVLLLANGGDCIDDVSLLHADEGLLQQ